MLRKNLLNNIIGEKNLIECEFFDIENLDGYFSGIVFLVVENKRYILNFGYDIELKNLRLMNCDNLLYNSDKEYYTKEKLEEIKMYYYDIFINKIFEFIN